MKGRTEDLILAIQNARPDKLEVRAATALLLTPFIASASLDTAEGALLSWSSSSPPRTPAVGPRALPIPNQHLITSQREDRIEIIEGIEFLIKDSRGRTVRVDWDLPPISKATGKKSVGRIMYWKQLHRVSSRTYYAYHKMTFSLLLASEVLSVENSNNPNEDILSESERHRKQAFEFLELTRLANTIFCSTINAFPEDLRSIRMIKILANLDIFCSSIQQAISSPASSASFHKGLTLSKKICEWLFEALHRADALLEEYLRGQTDGAK